MLITCEQVELKHLVGTLADRHREEFCNAHEDEPKWGVNTQLALYSTVEYGANNPKLTFQKGNLLLASLLHRRLRPHSSHQRAGLLKDDEIFGQVTIKSEYLHRLSIFVKLAVHLVSRGFLYVPHFPMMHFGWTCREFSRDDVACQPCQHLACSLAPFRFSAGWSS